MGRQKEFNMDVSSILGQIFNKDDLAGIISKAGSTEGDVTNVLTKALPLVAGQTTQRGFDLGSLTSLVGGNPSNIISSLLGSNGAQTVAQQSGVSEAATSSILSAAAPGLLSSLTGSNGSSILSMLGGLVGGTGADEKVDDMIATASETVTQAANTVTNTASNAGKKTESKFWSFISSLFGKK